MFRLRIFLLAVSLVGAYSCTNNIRAVPTPDAAPIASTPTEETGCLTLIPLTDPDRPGLIGRVEIASADYWVDSDGVKPDMAGVHINYTNPGCTVRSEVPPLPEACICLTGRAGTFLLETNPAAGECHFHKDGKGHPYVYDCEAFCKGSTDKDLGRAHGLCKAANVDGIASARCECS
jgi:hypothetical protein